MSKDAVRPNGIRQFVDSVVGYGADGAQSDRLRPDNLAKAFKISASSFRRGLTALPLDSTSPESGEMRKNLANIGIIPRDAQILEGVYTGLRDRMKTQLHDDEEGDLEFNKSLKALSYANCVLHLTSLSLREQPTFAAAQESDAKDTVIGLFENMAPYFPRSEAAVVARAELAEGTDMFLTYLEENLVTPVETFEQTVGRAKHVSTLLARNIDDWPEMDLGGPALNTRIGAIRSNAFLTVVDSPHVNGLIFSDAFGQFHSYVRGELFIDAMDRALDQSEEPDHAQANELGNLYLSDKGVRNYFWIEVLVSNKAVNNIAEWFFDRDANIAEMFTDESLEDITTATTKMTVAEQGEGIQKFLGLVADFQTAQPGHTNLDMIRQKVGQFVEGKEYKKNVDPLMIILRDEKVGIICIDEEGTAHAMYPVPGMDWNTFRDRTERDGRYRIAYESPPQESTSLKSAVESAPEKSASTTLEISSGEFVKNRWPDVQRVPQQEQAVLDHLQRQIKIDEELLLDHVTASQGIAISLKVAPALFPSLLPETHILSPLQALGVISVEYRNDTVSIFIDSERAHIKSAGPSRILLEGSFNNEEYLIVNGASEDFSLTPLHLLLSEAVLTTMKPRRRELLKGKDYSRVTGRVDTYNEKNNNANTPRIVPPNENHSDSSVDPENGVLIPIGNSYVRAELDWSGIKPAA